MLAASRKKKEEKEHPLKFRAITVENFYENFRSILQGLNYCNNLVLY